MQQAFLQNGKRTASANNPNYDFEGHNPLSSLANGNLLMSENGSAVHAGRVHGAAYTQGIVSREQPQRFPQPSQFDESLNAREGPSNSFLPKLQKVVSHQDSSEGVLAGQQMPFNNHRERMIGSSGNISHDGYNFGPGQSSMDPSRQLVQGLGGGSGTKQMTTHQQSSLPMSKAGKRSNKYLHGTPAQPTHNY